MFAILVVAAGIGWTATYVQIIQHGVRDRVYGMPLAALCANISWEFIFAFVHPYPHLLRPVTVVWFCVDLILVYQALKFGPAQFPSLKRGIFYAMFALTMASTYLSVLLLSSELGDRWGAYAAFGQNLAMSVLFLTMLHHRGTLAGQSLGIAVTKLLGTVPASLAFSLYRRPYSDSSLIHFLCAAIFVFDLLYVLAVRDAVRSRRTAGAGVPTARAGAEALPSQEATKWL
ncbi:hypothetical protein [Streptomyces sp. NPDC008317]|uniref:transmembrane-type terpene cyclase n=1 Tax=Streptomyces sp. NPDC008317 TaxID=3364827 RepID=UPI0036ECA57D